MAADKKDINKVKQSGNTAHGDVVGRDKTVTNNYFSKDVSALRRRSQELKDLYKNEPEFKGFIEKLEKFMTNAEGDKKSRTLEEKLKSGKRDDLVIEAKTLKERFSKKISKHQFSEQAQELFAHILAQINTFFNSKVRPLIAQGVDSSEIDSLIYEELIKDIYNDVGDGSLNIDMQDIKGMLFYLTGNCHLEWD